MLHFVPTSSWIDRFGASDGASDGASPQDSLAITGMAVFLASLGSFFAAAMVLLAVLRATSDKWPPAGAIPLPLAGLAVSTLILIASSLTLAQAMRGAKRGNRRSLRAGLLATTLLAWAFLISQVQNWLALHSDGVVLTSNIFAWLFYALTALHFLHVVGGLFPLTIVTLRSFAGPYGPQSRSGVIRCGMYWHFLDAVWVVMVLGLILAR